MVVWVEVGWVGVGVGEYHIHTHTHTHTHTQCQNMVPAMGLIKERLDVHAVYVPEGKFDVEAEGKRLKPIMDKYGNINIFISEGAGKDYIIEEMEAEGKTVPRDAFGHAKLDSVNVGKYYGDKLGALIGAEKVLVQKSGYFARSAAPNSQDLKLIKDCALKAVESAVLGKSGVIGHDEATPDLELRAIEFERIAGVYICIHIYIYIYIYIVYTYFI